MRTGVPKEIHQGERRLATTPDAAGFLQKLGFEVAIETGAGHEAKFKMLSFELELFLKNNSELILILRKISGSEASFTCSASRVL